MSENKAQILTDDEISRLQSEGDLTPSGRGAKSFDDFLGDDSPEEVVEEAVEEPAEEVVEEPAEEVVEEVAEEAVEEPAEEVVEEVSEPESMESLLEEDEDVAELSDITNGMFTDSDELTEFAEAIQKDPFMKGLFDYFRAEGNVTPYLDAMRNNYDEISDEDLLRQDFYSRFEGSGLNKEELESAFERKVLAKYNLNDIEDQDELDVKVGRAEMKTEANKLRMELKEQQQKFAAPPVVRDEPVDSEQQRREEIRLQSRAKKFVSDSLPEGKLNFNIGENEYTLNGVSQKEMVSMITDTDNIVEKALVDGKIDMRVLAFLSNPNEFLAKVENDAYAKAQERFIAENLQNKKPAVAKSAPASQRFNKKARGQAYLDQLAGAKVIN